MKTTGNTILITGGTSGIGLGLAQRLHESGNRVIVAGRRKALLADIASTHPGIEALELDVADPASIARARDAVATDYPDLNVLVNNAGIMLREDLLDPAALGIAEEQIVVNLLGTVRMTYAFLPLLRGKDDAAVMNMGSALAFVPMPATATATATYNATKAAVHSFSESLRVQLAQADAGVQVIEIAPPGVRTTLLGQQDDENAMPLDDFLDETLDLLREKPDAREIVVERARFVRDAAATGTYDDVLAALSRV